MRRVTGPAELPAALAAGSQRSGLGVRRRLGLPRAGDPPGPPHRGATARRRLRPGGRDRGARLLAPAPSSEARRGGAGTRPEPRRTAGPARARHPGRHGRRARRTPRPRSSSARRTGRSSSSRSTRGFRSSTGSPSSSPASTSSGTVLPGRRAPLSEAALAAAAGAADPAGHAIEVRIAAEDPGRDFARRPGASVGGSCRRAPASGSIRPSRPATASRRTTTT